MTVHTRRTVLKAAGASTIAAVVAGCSGSGDDDGEDNDDDTFEIDAGTEVVIDGYNSHWEGAAPDEIDGVENPTLVLDEGERYTIEWVNGDGIAHDLQIWDADDEVVDELATEDVADEDEGATLEFTAGAEMVTYVCSFHSGSQRGELVVE